MAAADWGALSGSSGGHQAVLINPGWECEGRGDAAVQARQGRGRVAAGGGAGWCDFALSSELLPQPAPLPGLWACSLGTCLYPHSPPSAPLPPSLPPAAPGQAAHAAPGAPRLCLHLCGEAARAGAVQTGARNSWSGCAANYTIAKLFPVILAGLPAPAITGSLPPIRYYCRCVAGGTATSRT